MTEKELHDKTISEISESCCGSGEYCTKFPNQKIGGILDNSVHVGDLKQWATSIVDWLNAENEKLKSVDMKPNLKHDIRIGRQWVIGWLRDIFELTEEDLK